MVRYCRHTNCISNNGLGSCAVNYNCIIWEDPRRKVECGELITKGEFEAIKRKFQEWDNEADFIEEARKLTVK